MASRSGSNTRKRTLAKSFRFSEDEWAEMQNRANRAGMNVADLVRSQCLDMPPPRKARVAPFDRKLACQLLGQLGKIGSNINQIAHAANLGKTLEGMIEAAAIDIMEMRVIWFETHGKKP